MSSAADDVAARIAELAQALNEARAEYAALTGRKPGLKSQSKKKGRRQAQTAAAAQNQDQATEQQHTVTPYQVSGTVDYARLLAQFGCDPVDAPIRAQLRQLQQPAEPEHRFFSRGIAYAHRDLGRLLASGQRPFLYTGRGASAATLHLGHAVPMLLAVELQRLLDAPMVIMLSDDEKFYASRGALSPADCAAMARANIADIIAFGFDVRKTFIFVNTEYGGGLEAVARRARQRISLHTARAVFGFDEGTSVGLVAYPAVQMAGVAAEAFETALGGRRMPCLVPCGIDQDPFFRLARDVMPKLGVPKPATVMSTFLPALSGSGGGKMSSSGGADAAVLLTDAPEDVARKMMASQSGAAETLEEHRARGADLDRDVAFQHLRFFLDDDARLAEIEREYGAGRMDTGEVKAEATRVVQQFVAEFQARRALVTDEVVGEFMAERPLEFGSLQMTDEERS